jgi:hypothetical protein
MAPLTSCTREHSTLDALFLTGYSFTLPNRTSITLFAKRTIPRFLTLILAVLDYIYHIQVSQTYVSGCRSVAENASLAELYQLRTVFGECERLVENEVFRSHWFKSIYDVIDSLLIDIRASTIEFLDELR